jgi:hypothetical protein
LSCLLLALLQVCLPCTLPVDATVCTLLHIEVAEFVSKASSAQNLSWVKVLRGKLLLQLAGADIPLYVHKSLHRINTHFALAVQETAARAAQDAAHEAAREETEVQDASPGPSPTAAAASVRTSHPGAVSER